MTFPEGRENIIFFKKELEKGAGWKKKKECKHQEEKIKESRGRKKEDKNNEEKDVEKKEVGEPQYKKGKLTGLYE